MRLAYLVDALAVVKPLANLIGALLREFLAYQVGVKGATIDHTETKDNHAFTDGVLHWWRVNGDKFPAWAQAAQIILAFTCSSAGTKRVSSMLKACSEIRSRIPWRTTFRPPSCSAQTSALLAERERESCLVRVRRLMPEELGACVYRLRLRPERP